MNLFSKHSSLENQNSKLVEQVGDLSIRLEQEHNFFTEEKQKTARLQNQIDDLREVIKENYYGHIDYLGNHGVVGEIMYFKTKDEFDKEVHDSFEIGRPITCHVYEEENELER